MPLTIVTYHFVRDLKNSRYPALRGRDLAEFKQQLDYFDNHYKVVDTADVVAAFKGEGELPGNAIWLTFDDGYLEHFTNVMPQLLARRMHGAFFATVNSTVHGELLDVNKAHFIRAAETDPNVIIDEIRAFIDARQDTDGLQPFDAYWREYAKPVRFDNAEIWFIKSVLQHALPPAVRKVLIDELFEKIVSIDQRDFAGELYASPDQLRTMIECGMYIGGHGAKHLRLREFDAAEKEIEVTASQEFLHSLGAPTTDWVMCYPYGESDETYRALLKQNGGALGLTIQAGLVDPAVDDPLLLSRLDTIELPIA